MNKDFTTVRLPAVPCRADLYAELTDLARRAGVIELDSLVRLALERFVAEEKMSFGWITLATLERLRSLAPEFSRAIGHPVITDEDVLCQLIDHWHRTKIDCHGRAPFVKEAVPLLQ